MSPTVFAVEHVLLPTLSKMGIDIDMYVVKNGYFPDVIGSINATIRSITESIKPISLISRGSK